MERMMEKDIIVMFDWKGLGEHKERIKRILEEMNINYERTDKY